MTGIARAIAPLVLGGWILWSHSVDLQIWFPSHPFTQFEECERYRKIHTDIRANGPAINQQLLAEGVLKRPLPPEPPGAKTECLCFPSTYGPAQDESRLDPDRARPGRR
jgi:hypothetical protein